MFYLIFKRALWCKHHNPCLQTGTPDFLITKLIRIPNTVFTLPHYQETWNTLFWNLRLLPSSRNKIKRSQSRHVQGRPNAIRRASWTCIFLTCPHWEPLRRLTLRIQPWPSSPAAFWNVFFILLIRSSNGSNNNFFLKNRKYYIVYFLGKKVAPQF